MSRYRLHNRPPKRDAIRASAWAALVVGFLCPSLSVGMGAPRVDPQQEAEAEAPDDEAAEVDPCRPEMEGLPWLDAVQLGLFRSVCSSARWFDGFFGDARFDEEADRTWGRLSVDTIYDELDELEAKARFRAEVDFPNLDHRLNTFFGQEDEESFVAGRTEGVEALPAFFRDAADREWLVGLGYRPVRGGGNSNRLDFRVGVRVRFPLEPFVQGRLRRYWFLSESRLVRFRNTVFWRNQRGFGDTVTLDFEQALGRAYLLRLSGSATLSESTRGLDWVTSATFYQGLGGHRALAYSLYVDGETDREFPVGRYGFRTVYRRQMLRDWFFGQLIGGVNFPRVPGADFETSWEVGVGFEIHYGRSPRAR